MTETHPILPERAGDYIPIKAVASSGACTTSTQAENVISHAGLSGPSGQHDTHDNDSAGATMWLTTAEDGLSAWISFDFGGTYPVGEMWVWNYNQAHPAYPGLHRRGLKTVVIEHSLDGKAWSELAGLGQPYQFAAAEGQPDMRATNLDDGRNSPVVFGNVMARYVRITAMDGPNDGNWGGFDGHEPYYGLSAVRFYAGRGLAAELADEWTQLLHRSSGWTGSDGINCIPLCGDESPLSTEHSNTTILFGDTFIGEVDQATDNRLATTMVNNTVAVLRGVVPDESSIEFLWNRDECGGPVSMLVPSTPKSLAESDTYYWLQDGTSIQNTLYCFPIIIGPDPEGPEGFQFKVHGVTRVDIPIVDDSLQFDAQRQVDTPLYVTSVEGYTTYFGAAIMPNTTEAGAPNPDEYVYIYGLQRNARQTGLVAARVTVADFEDFDGWRYWDGDGWNARPETAVSIAPDVSSELSVSPMVGGFLDHRFVVACQRGQYVSVYVGDSPIGPFEEATDLFYCAEPDQGNQIYAYNAKGHPHLSRPGELLISYNVNTTSWAAHMNHAEIYRPRFIRLRQLL